MPFILQTVYHLLTRKWSTFRNNFSRPIANLLFSRSNWDEKNRNLAIHSLALLRACRQIYEETKSLWLGRILFDFNHVITLLDKLSSLPAFTLSRIRFIRVSADPLVLRVEGQNHHPFYRLVWVLKLLPHLRLDTLTVLGTYHGPLNYITLGTFVQHGSCWKELRFVTRDSSMLGFSRAEPMGVSDPYRRKPQPLSWNQILLARDGTDSKARMLVSPSIALIRKWNLELSLPLRTVESSTKRLFHWKRSRHSVRKRMRSLRAQTGGEGRYWWLSSAGTKQISQNVIQVHIIPMILDIGQMVWPGKKSRECSPNVTERYDRRWWSLLRRGDLRGIYSQWGPWFWDDRSKSSFDLSLRILWAGRWTYNERTEIHLEISVTLNTFSFSGSILSTLISFHRVW